MQHSYRILAPAARDLIRLDAWVATNFGSEAAVQANAKLFRTFELLTQFQGLGRERPEIIAAPIRFYSEIPNWIIYRPGDPLLIHRVLSSRMSLSDLRL